MRNSRGTFKRDPDESYDISESSSRDPDAPHASDSWPEIVDAIPQRVETSQSNDLAKMVAGLKRRCREKDSTIAALRSMLQEGERQVNIYDTQIATQDDRFFTEMEDRIDHLEHACEKKDKTITELKSSVRELEIMCKEYIEELDAMKAIMLDDTFASLETKKDREIVDMRKAIREQTMEIYTMRVKMDHWKGKVIPELQNNLIEKDRILSGYEFEKDLRVAELQEIRVPQSPKRERTMAEFEIRQLNAVIEDLQEQLRQAKEPSELQRTITELESELHEKQVEINDMDHELESVMHQLWLAEERNQQLRNMLDSVQM